MAKIAESVTYTGVKIWKLDHQLHRKDGPAVELVDGNVLWYLDNIDYSFEDWAIELNLRAEQIVMYKLEYF